MSTSLNRSSASTVPAAGAINTDGLDVDEETMAELTAVDEEALRAELPQVEEYLAGYGDHLGRAGNVLLAFDVQ